MTSRRDKRRRARAPRACSTHDPCLADAAMVAARRRRESCVWHVTALGRAPACSRQAAGPMRPPWVRTLSRPVRGGWRVEGEPPGPCRLAQHAFSSGANQHPGTAGCVAEIGKVSLAREGSGGEGGRALEAPGTFSANLSQWEGQRGRSQGRNWGPWGKQGPLLPPGANPGCAQAGASSHGTNANVRPAPSFRRQGAPRVAHATVLLRRTHRTLNGAKRPGTVCPKRSGRHATPRHATPFRRRGEARTAGGHRAAASRWEIRARVPRGGWK